MKPQPRTIRSYEATITDSVLSDMLPETLSSVTLFHIYRPIISGYGQWKLLADMIIDGKEVTIRARTNNESLSQCFTNQGEWRGMTEPEMSQEEAGEAILAILIEANEHLFE